MTKVICGGGDGQGHEAHWREDRTCSFCGSMRPEDFLQAMLDTLDPESPVWIDQTTKNYKRYVHDGSAQRKFYLWHIPTDEWAAEANRIDKHVKKFSQTKMERHVNRAMEALTEKDKP